MKEKNTTSVDTVYENDKVETKSQQLDFFDVEPTNCIQAIRNKRVIIDSDLAKLYGVSTKRLNEQVKRNAQRFPNDFMFALTEDEKKEVVAKCDHLKRIKYSSALPNVFTEHGVVMAASVLNTDRAIQVSLYVVRAFVSMRHQVSSIDGFHDLKEQINLHNKAIVSIIRVVRELMENDDIKSSSRRIGFLSS